MSTDPTKLLKPNITPFASWIRTGRWVPAQIADAALEVKFNPNHDPRDGRFTFRDGGSGSAQARTAGARKVADGKNAHDPANHDTYTVQPGDTLTHVAATRVGVTVSDLAQLNGLAPDAKLAVGQTLIVPTQDHLDRAKQGFDASVAIDAYLQTHGGQMPPNRAPVPTLAEQVYGPGTRQVTVNGYTFTLDPQGRTEQVTGTLTSNPDQKRSRHSQDRAGGSDRLPTDQDGHYIARQFNGPPEAFNHFAQDADFNRQDYATLERGWAKALAKGEKVHVTISSSYDARSKQPDTIYVSYTKGGFSYEQKFPNRSAKGGR